MATIKHSFSPSRPSRLRGLASSRAFTLVELMLSLAMVLILIVGINFVFRTATDAIGAGNTYNAINADAQSAQPMLFNDLRNIAKNPPAFIISSQLVTQYLNTDDAKTSSDPAVIPLDNAGNYAAVWAKPSNLATKPQQILSPAILGPRNHRTDMLEFFAHGFYPRRSGPTGSYLASDTADDAFIQICHGALPSNSLTAFYGPSSLPNTLTGWVDGAQYAPPTNPGVPRLGAYASDWVLARRVTLLKNASSMSTGDFYYQTASATPAGLANFQFGANMSPLSYGTLDSNSGATQFQSSRYDIAGVTPEQFDRIIANAILNWQTGGYTGPSLWWNPLVYSFWMTQYSMVPSLPPAKTVANAVSTPPYVVPYYNSAPVGPPTNAGPQKPYDNGLWYNRPQVNPLIQSPLTSAAVAQMAPYFLQHCSQFVVEYTGDYLQQDTNPADLNKGSYPSYGDITGIGPKGQLDFYVDANGNKHIRWYGMPRSSTGVPHLDMPASAGTPSLVLIRGYDPASGLDNTGTAGLLNYFTDVIPLRDYYSMWVNSQAGGAARLYAPPWEVDVNFDPAHDYGEYTVPGASGPTFPPQVLRTGNNNAFASAAVGGSAPRYVAAWHDDMPAMIRILIKVDDPNNLVKDGPWFEYVFRLK